MRRKRPVMGRMEIGVWGGDVRWRKDGAMWRANKRWGREEGDESEGGWIEGGGGELRGKRAKRSDAKIERRLEARVTRAGKSARVGSEDVERGEGALQQAKVVSEGALNVERAVGRR